MKNKKTKWIIEFELKQCEGGECDIKEEIEAGLEQFIHEMIVGGFDIKKMEIKQIK